MFQSVTEPCLSPLALLFYKGGGEETPQSRTSSSLVTLKLPLFKQRSQPHVRFR